MTDRTERPPDDELEPIEGSAEGPGSDPGAAYGRAVEEGEIERREDEEPGPDVGDVFRSGP